MPTTIRAMPILFSQFRPSASSIADIDWMRCCARDDDADRSGATGCGATTRAAAAGAVTGGGGRTFGTSTYRGGRGGTTGGCAGAGVRGGTAGAGGFGSTGGLAVVGAVGVDTAGVCSTGCAGT